ncbi:TlpA family protein disulfide reductase [Haloarchaeobius iranensis]|uniref:TlpA family protein disulfide reductase n=1 Tax=Haloarchaeobius iranensis TaxID=996166 RepID=UPI001587A611|nr:TlpA disulfide reductase family protein [Haloarchaeobius iranensis]
MRRRELLGAVAAATTVATAGCNSLGRTLTGDDGDDPESVTVETIDASGSRAGSTVVPEPGRVTFVEFFATTCPICASQMSVVGDAYRQTGEDVQFLSVTSEPVGLTVSREDVAAWWDDHDGGWPVGVDDGVALARKYGATSIPTAVVVAPDGTVAWSHTGRTTASRIVAEIRAAGGDSTP